jgi:hypothetical protein
LVIGLPSRSELSRENLSQHVQQSNEYGTSLDDIFRHWNRYQFLTPLRMGLLNTAFKL